jgi:hypothetical protein
MNQAQLDNIKETAAGVVNQYSSGYADAMLRGTEQIGDLFEHCLRLHYLWGVLNEVRLSGTSLYVGNAVISGDDVEDVYSKIWHYNGIFASVDLSDYSDIVADDGDGGTSNGDTGTGISSDHYRSNDITSVVGTNVVTFSSPLPSSDYTVTVYNTGANGYLQKNLVVSTKTANGFVCGDVLEAGTLTYFAVIDL